MAGDSEEDTAKNWAPPPPAAPQALGQTGVASLLLLTGHRATAAVRAGPLPLLPPGWRARLAPLLPAARTRLLPVRQALVQRPVYATVGTAAGVATLAASTVQAPAAVKETVTVTARLAGGVKAAVMAAASLADSVGRQTAQATTRTTHQALAVASSIAGVAKRGAAGIMMATARPGGGGKLSGARGVAAPRMALAAERTQRLALAAVTRQ